jgi:hypothetical protein
MFVKAFTLCQRLVVSRLPWRLLYYVYRWLRKTPVVFLALRKVVMNQLGGK